MLAVNYIALVFGIVCAIVIINVLPITRRAAYPILLATFPVYYWAFALIALNYVALVYEILAGLVFFIIALCAIKLSHQRALYVLAIGFIGHACYDVIPPLFYTPAVAPSWWPEFCGSVDLILGVFVLMRAKQLNTA